MQKCPGPICGFTTGYEWIDAGTLALTRMVDPVAQTIGDFSEQSKKISAYEFFASFFSHYLPKKLIWHYIYRNGESFHLTRQQMVDCNPYITLLKSRKFNDCLRSMAEKTPRSPAQPQSILLRFTTLAGALTNGTLGQFTVNVKGNLIFKAMDNWEFVGTMDFYDEWDFDIKDFDTGGRSLQGELKTRFAHYVMPGQGFKVNSETVGFTQSNNDDTVAWQGGKPVATLDQVAQLDVSVRNDYLSLRNEYRSIRGND